jgi:hypothetical protein
MERTSDYLFTQSAFTSLLPINPPAEAYADGGWNGDTGAPQKDAIRDILIVGDTDADGKADVVDLGTAGIVRTTSGGVISAAELSGEVTTSASNAVTIADSVAVTSWNLTTPAITGAATWEDGTRQTFNPNGTNAGLNVGSQAGDPSGPSNGDLWYDSTNNTLDARINGATVSLGAGGAGAPTDADYLVGTANGSLSAEIVVGTSPGGELGGTWGSPTLDDSVAVSSWTLTTPTVSGTLTLENAMLYASSAMGALAVDVTELDNTKTISTDSTLTFSATPSTGQIFGLAITNSDSAAHTITIPSSKSEALGGAARTTFVLAPSQQATLKWRHEGSSVYTMWGDPVRILDLTSATPVGADTIEFYDATDGLSKRGLISDIWTNWTDIVDASGDTAIALGAHETDWTSSIDASGESAWTLTMTDADVANDTSAFDIKFNDGADANGFYLRMIGDADGTPTNDYLFSQTGATFTQPLSLGTSGVFTAGTIELGAASDTTLARSGAGAITVEGTAVLLSGGALGTPSSGTVTNLTGTASININGTVGATTPAAGTFTTLVAGNTTSLLLGTAGSAVGNIGFRNATSGTATLAPPTGALGTYTVTLPNAASTLPIFGQQITFAGPTAARTVTLPDASFTAARTDAANTFTGVQTMDSPVINTKLQYPNGADATLSTAGDSHLNTTDEQLSFHSAADGEISGEAAVSIIQHRTWSFDPKAVCDGAVDRLFLMTVGDDAPEGITIDEWKVSFEADPTTEVALDFKSADAFIGVANAAVLDVLDTTAGVSSEDTDANINSGSAVANAKVLYLEFGTAYTETNHQIVFEIWYHAEED